MPQPAEKWDPASDWRTRETEILSWPQMRIEIKRAWQRLAQEWTPGTDRISLARAYAILTGGSDSESVCLGSACRRIKALERFGLVRMVAAVDLSKMIVLHDPLTVPKPARAQRARLGLTAGGERQGQLLDEEPPTLTIFGRGGQSANTSASGMQSGKTCASASEAQVFPVSSADTAPVEPARASMPPDPSIRNDDSASLTTYNHDDDDEHVPTNERTEFRLFERAYAEVFWPAVVALAGTRNGDRVDPPRRAPLRVERLVLLKLAVVALEESNVPALIEACGVTRDAKRIDSSRLNHLKGTFANLVGITTPKLFERIDRMNPPEQFVANVVTTGGETEGGDTTVQTIGPSSGKLKLDSQTPPDSHAPPPPGYASYAQFAKTLPRPAAAEE